MKKFLVSLLLSLLAAFGLCASVCAEETADKIIFDFSSPLFQNCIDFAYFGDEYNGYITSVETVKDADNTYGCLGKSYLEIRSTYNIIQFRLSFDGHILPKIDEASDYELFVLRAEGISNYVVHYDTENSVKNDSFAASSYDTATFDTMEVFFSIDTRVDSWSGQLNALEFEIICDGNSKNENDEYVVRIDYASFFDAQSTSDAFIANPQHDDPDETQESIDALFAENIEEFNSYFDDAFSVPAGYLAYNDDGSIKVSSLKNLIKQLLLDEFDNFYVVVEEYVAPESGEYYNFNGTNGSIKFTVYFASSPTNGYCAATNSVTLTLESDKYFEFENMGAQIRSDGADDALRFGFKVGVGSMTGLKSSGINFDYTQENINESTGGFDFSKILRSDWCNMEIFEAGAYVVPLKSLTDQGLGVEDFVVANMSFLDNDQIFIGDYEVASVLCKYIFQGPDPSLADTCFVYTVVITDIEDADAELVVLPYLYGRMTESYGESYFQNCFAPITRSVNGVKKALNDAQTTDWDKDSDNN